MKDTDPSAHLAMGEFTYTRMKACFEILKSMAQVSNAAASNASTGESRGHLLSAGNGGNNGELEHRVQELEQLVQQRDNEIAIMVKMIRKDPKALEATDALTRGNGSNQDEAHDGKARERPSARSSEGYASSVVVDPAILDDPVKAFEAFKTQYPKNDAIRDNKVALKRKYDAAKTLASQVNEARNQIKALTCQMEKVRKQQAIANEGLLGHRDEDETSTAATAALLATEEKCKAQIDTYKSAYKKGFHDLSELKKEIQHIQKMLEMGRLKLQKEFDLWYQRQGKGALLTKTLLEPEAKETLALAKPTKASSPEKPGRILRTSTAWDSEAKPSTSTRLSAARYDCISCTAPAIHRLTLFPCLL